MEIPMFDVIRTTVKAFSQIHLRPWQDLGNILLLGEGNLSFARSLMRQPFAHIIHMTVTTYEKEKDLVDLARQNASLLRRGGATVIHGVDATNLEKSLWPHEFDTIVFQFPNVGSRDAKSGHNPNHVMIRKFLCSAVPYLAPSGKIMISAVNSGYYHGVFKFDEAAAFAGYEAPEIYPFDPSLFTGYSHTNTNDDESALDEHSRFATWVFRPKT
jgi:25S rRNA (uracil2634-N3)-methyltransferase